MIPKPFNNQSMVLCPIDQAVIKTSFRLKEVPGDYLPHQLHLLPPDNGMSDMALRKHCVTLGIDLPRRGHWVQDARR